MSRRLARAGCWLWVNLWGRLHAIVFGVCSAGAVARYLASDAWGMFACGSVAVAAALLLAGKRIDERERAHARDV